MAVFTGEHWRVLSRYLDEALDLTADERPSWLAAVRGTDPGLASDLEELLDQREALDRDGFLAGTAMPMAAEPSLAGLQVGAYTLVSPIGRGGMGSVWLAERNDGRFQRRAAVKLLNAALIGRAGEARFRLEGRVLARLTHPHIAHLLDAGVTAMGQPYLVLELVEGEPIDAYCAQRALGVTARLRLFLDVADAVAHAHANLIVHRDIKPSNVLVRGDGVVKLLDFGIAKLLERRADEDGPALTAVGLRALTPEYAAPEQLTGGPITTATDVHALGVLLYVLLGGPSPASAASQSPADLIKAVVETELPRVSDVSPYGAALRGDLDIILAKATKKRPEERYPTVTALADDIRRYLRHEPVTARPDTFVYRATKLLQRRKRALAAAAAAALLLVSVIGFYTVRLAAERDRARLEADKAARVSELLTSLLTGADPYATRDREPTVRGLLDAGAARVRAELAGHPELRAEMLTVIGRVYQRLGLLEQAAPPLEEALAIGRRLASGDSARLAQTLNDLGILRRERGDPAAATPLLEDALVMRRRLLGAGHKDVAVTLVELGRAFVDRGVPERAEPLFREALDVRRALFGETHRETSTSKADLGLLLLRRGDLDEGERLLREALNTSLATLADDHPNVGAGWNNLGLARMERGDPAGAEPMFRRALAIRRRHFGDRHPSLGNSMGNLAASLRDQQQYAEAAVLLERALDLTRAARGDDDPAIGRLQADLARVHLARGAAAAAAPLLRDALIRQQKMLRPDDWKIAATKSALGAALMALGHHDEAEALLRDAAAVLRPGPGRQGREAAATRDRLAALAAARSAR